MWDLFQNKQICVHDLGGWVCGKAYNVAFKNVQFIKTNIGSWMEAVVIGKIPDLRRTPSNDMSTEKIILHQGHFQRTEKGKSDDEGYISRSWPFKILFSIWQFPSFCFLCLGTAPLSGFLFVSYFSFLFLFYLHSLFSLINYPPFARHIIQ